MVAVVLRPCVDHSYTTLTFQGGSTAARAFVSREAFSFFVALAAFLLFDATRAPSVALSASMCLFPPGFQAERRGRWSVEGGAHQPRGLQSRDGPSGAAGLQHLPEGRRGPIRRDAGADHGAEGHALRGLRPGYSLSVGGTSCVVLCCVEQNCLGLFSCGV